MAHGQLEFGWEPIGDVVEEYLPLMKRQAEEVGEGEIDPNLPWFFAQARAGILKIFAARRDGVLVGYIVFLVCPSTWNVKILMGIANMFWLSPAERFGWSGINLFRNAEKALKELGVQRVDFYPKIDLCNDKGYTVASLLERLGYRKVEWRMTKDL